jgi:NADPH-dependent 2,4-dienoyl-CoA reductase/sulfur reductase-like enzyme
MAEFLIIGADAAGLSAALQVKRKRSAAEVKVVAKGRIISYGACGIPYVLSGDIASADKLINFTSESFQERSGIVVETGREAMGLDPERREVEVKDLDSGAIRREPYGRLLIATGAEPRRLPFLDHSLEGVFNLHTVEDLNRSMAFIREKEPRRAAVIGAGNIGLELAEALSRRGLAFSLVDVMDRPVATWPALTQKAVMAEIKNKGVDFRPGTAITSVEKRGEEFILHAEKVDIRADIIFSVAGTKPATGFCGGKLETLPNGAILTDSRARTSVPDIFAAGDCAAVLHRVLGCPAYIPLGSTANKVGRLAGMNMVGVEVEFPGVVGTQIFKFFDLSLARTGLSLEEAVQAGFQAEAVSSRTSDRSGYYPGASQVEVEIVFDKPSGRLLGAAASSRVNAAQFIDPAAMAVSAGLTVRDLAWFDAAYAPPFAPVWNALVSAAFQAARF